MSEKNVYRVKLMRWGDSSSSGRTVTFKLPDDTEEHPFKNFPVGSKNGQLVEIEVEILDEDLPLETLDANKKPITNERIGPKVTIIREPVLPVKEIKAPRAHIIDKRPAATVKAESPAAKPTTAPLENQSARPAKPAIQPADRKTNSPIPDAWQAPAMPKPVAMTAPPNTPATTPPAAMAPATPAPQAPAPAYAPTPSPQQPAPVQASAPSAAPTDSTGVASVASNSLEAYAGQMSQAAEALASAAEKLDSKEETDDRPRLPLPDDEDEIDREPIGIRTVRRAVELCTSVDKKRAGFFYYMRAMYPDVPPAQKDDGKWSRDAKATRDRVCFHCETSGISGLADDVDARKKFEELEHAFERHERLR